MVNWLAPPKSPHRLVLVWLLISGFAFGLYYLEDMLASPRGQSKANEAALTMIQMMRIIREEKEKLGFTIDLDVDINQTGLIGEEYTPITTTLGSLEAKRSSTNPHFAALITWMLMQAGVSEGDFVAIGSSGSFPALWVATMAACQALKAHPISIISLTASQWGANLPEFTLLEISQVLIDKGFHIARPHGFSLGGHEDQALDLEDQQRLELQQRALAYSIPMISAEKMGENVEHRWNVYMNASPKGEIKVFVNIGGALANTGDLITESDLVSGLNHPSTLKKPPQGGLIEKMVDHGIPVIHLLYLKSLVEQYDMDWDPIPLPDSNNFPIPAQTSERRFAPWIVIIYFMSLGISWGFLRRSFP